MDINFKGLVLVDLNSVSLTLKEDYVPSKGPNAGVSQGPIIFIGKGTPTVRAIYASAHEALQDVVNDAPKGTKVYANSVYMPLAQAAELELEGFQYKAAGRAEPYWNSLSFWTVEAAEKKNGTAGKPTKAAKKAKAGNLPKM